MKTLRNTIIALSLLMFAGIAVKASDKPEKKTLNYALIKYIEGTAHGKINNFSELLDEDFKLGLLHGQKAISFNKKQFLQDLKNMEDISQQCKTTYFLLENNANFAVARVEMKYLNFTRINCINMKNTSNGWKITNIFTTFK